MESILNIPISRVQAISRGYNSIYICEVPTLHVPKQKEKSCLRNKNILVTILLVVQKSSDHQWRCMNSSLHLSLEIQDH